MGPIYVELTPVTGDKESIIINFMDIDDIIAAHGNEFEFKGRVNQYDNLELPHTIIIIGGKRIPVVQSSAEVIKKIQDEFIAQY